MREFHDLLSKILSDGVYEQLMRDAVVCCLKKASQADPVSGWLALTCIFDLILEQIEDRPLRSTQSMEHVEILKPLISRLQQASTAQDVRDSIDAEAASLAQIIRPHS